MKQSDWAARVAEIGKLAGWDGFQHLNAIMITGGAPSFAAFDALLEDETDPAVIRAIEQLAADWLAAKGVVAERVCRWTKDDDGDWVAGCCENAERAGGPFDAMYMAYCPRCGGKIEVAP